MIQWWFNDDSTKIQRWFNEDSTMIQWWFNDHSTMIQPWFNDDSMMMFTTSKVRIGTIDQVKPCNNYFRYFWVKQFQNNEI